MLPHPAPARFVVGLPLAVVAGGIACSDAPARVSIRPAVDTIALEHQFTYKGVASGSDGLVQAGRVVTWSSSDIGVASVTGTDSDGLVTGKGVGTATITADVEGVTATATVTVEPAVSGAIVSPSAAILVAGETQQLTAKATNWAGPVDTNYTTTWTSSDPTVARVSPTGLVTTIKAGTASIAATLAGFQRGATIVVYHTVSGKWHGTGSSGGSTLLINWTATEGADHSLSGGGTVQIVGVSAIGPLGFGSTGIRTGLNVTSTMVVPGFIPFIFTGVYADSTITGSVSNSGFAGFQTTYTRSSPAPAPSATTRVAAHPAGPPRRLLGRLAPSR